jgi:Flp pilus assembly protein TadD
VEVAANAVKEYPDEPRFVYPYADALANTGKLAEATRLLQGLIDKDPLDADALNSLGYMLAERGVRLPEAVTLIERALKVDPDNPAYLDSLAWALFKQGKDAEAETPMRKAATAMPRESVIQDHLGDVLARRGKSDEAVSAWERALAGDGQGIDRAAVEKKIKDAKGRRK